MITYLTLKNFKSITEQRYEFSEFDLLVGRNNSGKSTILQALAIWQFCIDEFRQTNRRGKNGTQIVLPNFTALPVPEFNLLWREKTDRRYSLTPEGTKKPEYILIDIDVTWMTEKPNPQCQTFGVRLRYNSPQTIYAIPAEGWARFRQLEGDGKNINSCLPIIAYVPPFSGLEPSEERRDDGPIRQQIGKAQPGSVLRNLLLRVWENNREDWQEIQRVLKNWFNVDLNEPRYNSKRDTKIQCEYRQFDKLYDIIAGGSGFHQTLTLLAFFYGYRPTTILLDEPDAHLHVNLQREILDYFKNRSSINKKSQFLIATHAEEFIQGVDIRQVISLLEKIPKRVEAKPAILSAMAEVSNLEVTQLTELKMPMLLYVEGETDERLLRSWASVLGYQEILSQLCLRVMRGGSKDKMKSDSDRHFDGVKQIIPRAKRLILFDYDSSETAFHPPPNNPSLYEWQRKNIENYLLVPDVWLRAYLQKSGISNSENSVNHPIKQIIMDFFSSENLTLPPHQSWREVKANIFKVVDGKKLLFQADNALFHQLKQEAVKLALPYPIELTRETVANNMTSDEIHEDVYCFFRKIAALIEPSSSYPNL